jgi:hypothetical protein
MGAVGCGTILATLARFAAHRTPAPVEGNARQRLLTNVYLPLRTTP